MRGLRDDQISVVYQPIVSVKTRQTFAQEVLTRCSAPMYPSPSDLFEAATIERCVGRLGRRVRELAYEEPPEGPLFINIHPGELSERWLVRPDDPLCFSQYEVFLEITEAATFSHYELCVDVLEELRARTGAHIVIDDFGAGFSNLRRIVDLSPKVVKLDRALVTGLPTDSRRQILVEGVVDLCHRLDIQVVAEGIETADELKACIDCGVELVQGYLLGRPSRPAVPSLWPGQR